eukprot:UN28443
MEIDQVRNELHSLGPIKSFLKNRLNLNLYSVRHDCGYYFLIWREQHEILLRHTKQNELAEKHHLLLILRHAYRQWEIRHLEIARFKQCAELGDQLLKRIFLHFWKQRFDFLLANQIREEKARKFRQEVALRFWRKVLKKKQNLELKCDRFQSRKRQDELEVHLKIWKRRFDTILERKKAELEAGRFNVKCVQRHFSVCG